jgi:phospholipid/cholesterol/gamma-HCH transport system permease protein
MNATAVPGAGHRQLEWLGAHSVHVLEEIGRFFYILHYTLYWSVRRPFNPGEWMRQMVRVGVDSLPVVGLTAMFTGMVMALQTYRGFERFHAESFVASVVSLSLTRELAPVLAALMIAGRIGSSLAAELGTMRVTEQIDALESLGRAPSSHLIVPRVLAALIMIPALTVFANASGIMVGWWAVKQVLPVTNMDFTYGAQYYFRPWDAWYSLIKSFFFGGTIGLISCYMGMNTKQGAEGVGKGTTGAVVTSTVIVLLLDTVLTKLLLNT